jgi:hypothetical protein
MFPPVGLTLCYFALRLSLRQKNRIDGRAPLLSHTISRNFAAV